MPNGLSSRWTNEHVDLLQKRWADGESASVIAYELGAGFSRSAVIGKVHRMRLDKRRTVTMREMGVTIPAKGERPHRRKGDAPRRRRNGVSAYCGDPAMIQERVAAASVRSEFYATEVADLTEEQKAKAVTFAAFKSSVHCRWPYGDPSKPDFVFCGCERLEGSSYCEPHTRIGTVRR